MVMISPLCLRVLGLVARGAYELLVPKLGLVVEREHLLCEVVRLLRRERDRVVLGARL